MAHTPPIDDNYIDEVIKSTSPYNEALNKTQGVKLRELIKKLRDYFEQEIQQGLNEQTFANITERNAYEVTSLPFQAFVMDDGDGNWALYRATSTGVGASYIKISDPDLLNAVMSSSAIKAAYESNADTNAFTDADKERLSNSITKSSVLIPDRVLCTIFRSKTYSGSHHLTQTFGSYYYSKIASGAENVIKALTGLQFIDRDNNDERSTVVTSSPYTITLTDCFLNMDLKLGILYKQYGEDYLMDLAELMGGSWIARSAVAQTSMTLKTEMKFSWWQSAGKNQQILLRVDNFSLSCDTPADMKLIAYTSNNGPRKHPDCMLRIEMKYLSQERLSANIHGLYLMKDSSSEEE